VTAVDISREVLEVAEQNEKTERRENKTEIEWIEGNAFDLMRLCLSRQAVRHDCARSAAFAKSKKHLESAVRGYKELNLRR